jgi:hypothetical protein
MVKLIQAVFTDSKGQDVLILRRHKAFLSGTYYVEDMSGKEVVTFTKSEIGICLSIPLISYLSHGQDRPRSPMIADGVDGKEIAAAFVDHASQQRRELRIVAKWRKSRGSIFLDGMYLGLIAKEQGSFKLGMCPTVWLFFSTPLWSSAVLMADLQYRLNVPEGLDVALMAVLGVVFARLVTEWNEGAVSLWT